MRGRKRYYQALLLTMLLSCSSSIISAQTDTDRNVEKMINASRAGASPLFFTADMKQVIAVNDNFNEPRETSVRGGLPNFFAKINKGEILTVGYIGGSITQAVKGYRLQSAGYIQSLSPASNMRFLNAGVSGTGTDLAACRLHDQLLVHQPDLIFIEFAVNGAYQQGMEGMVRQIIRNNPRTDICLVYTLITGQAKIYENGDVPENIKGLEKIAEHYQLPSIHLGMEAAWLEENNRLVWKGSSAADGQILFSSDGVHPLEAGGDLYAAAIARGLKKIKESSAASVAHVLPDALFSDNWEQAQMIDPVEAAIFSNGWKKVITSEVNSLQQFSNWFGYVMQTEKPGASFAFRFKGTLFGFYDLGGPEVGQVTIEVDGKPVMLQEVNEKGFHYYKVVDKGGTSLINRFNVFCNNRYRGQYEFVETSPGEHTVKVSLSSSKSDKASILGPGQQQDITQHPEKYDRTVLYLGKVLVKGELIK